MVDSVITSVTRRAQALADRTGVVYRRTALDEWAEKITELSGDEVVSDATADLLVALVRAKVLTAQGMAQWLVEHEREKKKKKKKKASPPLS